MRRVKVKQNYTGSDGGQLCPSLLPSEEIRIFCIENVDIVRIWEDVIDINTMHGTRHNILRVERAIFDHAEIIEDNNGVIPTTKTTNITDFDKFVEYIKEAI